MKQIFDSMALELAKAAAEVSEMSFIAKPGACAMAQAPGGIEACGGPRGCTEEMRRGGEQCE